MTKSSYESLSGAFTCLVRFSLVTMALVLVVLPGCSCREETPAERAAREAREAEEEKRQQADELARQDWILPLPTVQPGVLTTPSLSPKPGHWNGVTQPIRSGPKNQNDFDGEMQLVISDRDEDAIPLERTPFRLVTERPVVVARQSSKDIESWFYCPATGEPMRLKSIVRERRGGAPYESISPVRALLDHQYHFVVLAKEPERYAFLDSLYSVTSNLPSDADTTSASKGLTLPAEKNYRVIALPTTDPSRSIALPDNPLAWSSIAYLLWDEVDPDALRVEQREAIVDWLNWGGQLIVNGPDSLDLIKGSFLEPLLPAINTGAREISADDLQRVVAHWSATRRGDERLAVEKPWSGVALKLNKGSDWLPGLDELLAERRVGRGRIIVSAFQLAQRDLINWSGGVDNLYNAALLRRPPRQFRTDPFDEKRAVALWTTKPMITLDPMRNSQVRFFARDLFKDPQKLRIELKTDSGDPLTGAQPAVGVNFGAPAGATGDYQSLKPPVIRGGAAAWSDANLVAQAARSALRQSAGVSIPGAGFVVACLGAYLLFIAPLNWFLFSALGRVELAWVAAPIIALAGAWVVVQQAQLDIGFVRSQTEIAILEIQPDTPRSMLTRYNALYTSLSTTYELEFDHGMAFAAPFPRLKTNEQNDSYDQLFTASYDRQEKARLRGLAVSSNSAEFVLSEEMISLSEHSVPGSSLEGSVVLINSDRGTPRIINRTEWSLRQVVVVQRPDGFDGPAMLEGCWIGDVTPGEASNVAFSRLVPPSEDAVPFAAERQQSNALLDNPDDQLDLEKLFALALDAERFEPGERRIVALVDQSLPGLIITPEASQKRGVTLLVSHLRYGPLPPPNSDKNAPIEVVRN